MRQCDLKSCLKPAVMPEFLESEHGESHQITPTSPLKHQLRSPVLWYDGADMVFHYPFNPWEMLEALDSGDRAAVREAVRAANTPVLYGTDHALQEFALSESNWHFDSHLSCDRPRLYLPIEETRETSPVAAPSRDDTDYPIGVLIEYCCDEEISSVTSSSKSWTESGYC